MANIYEGFVNQDTWYLVLLVNNDSALQRRMLTWRRSDLFTPTTACLLGQRLFNYQLPDGYLFSMVNWREVAEEWNIRRKEINQS